MLLPDNGREFAISGTHDWDRPKLGAFAGRGFVRLLLMTFRTRRTKTNPEARLAHMLMNVQSDATNGRSADLESLRQLEAQLAVTEDVEIRKVFASYLCEP